MCLPYPNSSLAVSGILNKDKFKNCTVNLAELIFTGLYVFAHIYSNGGESAK